MTNPQPLGPKRPEWDIKYRPAVGIFQTRRNEMKLTHPARTLSVKYAKRSHLPSLTPIVGDTVVYLVSGRRVTARQALVAMKKGIEVKYETYEEVGR